MKFNINSITLNKVISVFIAVCFFVSAVCMDAIASVSVPVLNLNQQIFDDFGLTYNYGKITKAHFAGTDRVVINIQDLHCHPQIQKNISSIIEMFDKKYGVSNVYLEGAYGTVSTKWLTKNLDKNNKTEILNKIIETGKLTGAEYFSALTDKTEIIKGLEKKLPYLDNLKRFGDILEKQDDIEQILKAIENFTQKIKKQYYTKRQYKIEKLSKQYNEGKINPDKYYTLLLKHTEKLGIDLSKYKNTLMYVNLLKLQKKLNHKKIKKDLQLLLSIIKQKITYENYSTLLAETDNFKNIGKLCLYMKEISESYNIDLINKFSNLNKYFSYIEIRQKINPLDLLKEEEQLTREINTKFSDTTAQAEVVFFVYFEKYLKQYLTTKITPSDYQYYKENIEIYKILWNKYADNKLLVLLNDYLVETDKFYEINMDRNNYFAENIFEGIKINKIEQIKEGKTEINKIINNMENVKRVDIIVTGGFHTEKVTDILEENDVSYIVITPNIKDGVKEAEQTYYQTAKLQKEIDFQTLATLPFSSYGTNYRTAAAIEAFPKEAEEIFGIQEVERVKNLIKNGNIKVKEENIKSIKKYREELKKDIDISKILQADDIDLKDLKSLIKNIGDFSFTQNSLSEEDLTDIAKGIVELMNNKDSSLVKTFFDNLTYQMDMAFFKIVKASSLNRRIVAENVKTAMKNYLELTNYDFYTLEEMFYYMNEIGDVELKEIVNVLLDKDDENKYKNKSFVENNVDLITSICSAYKGNDLTEVLDLFSQKYKTDKDFITNNSSKLSSIVRQKHDVKYLEEILNLFLEKDSEGNYKNKSFVERNKDFIVTVCKAYKNENAIKVLKLFFDKNEQDKNFISQFVQDFDIRNEANQNIMILVEQQYPFEQLKEILDILLTKKDGIYIYEKFLKETRSYFVEIFFTRYSIASKDMFMFILEYISLINSLGIDMDIEFNLTKTLFDSLKESFGQISKEQQNKIIDKLVNILAKYCEQNNLMDKKVREIRLFLLNNINPNEKTENNFADIILDSFENMLHRVQNGTINKEEYVSTDALIHFIFSNYDDKDKNFIINPKQKARFIKILSSYYLELETIFKNYDDKEISKFDHNKNSFLGLTVKNSQLRLMTNSQQDEEKQERKEKLLMENMKLLFKNIKHFSPEEQDIIFNGNTDKAKKILNVISDINDFELLNNSVKKMFVNSYITSPVTLKEYSIDTEAIERNNIKTRKGKNPPLLRNKEDAKKRNCNDVAKVAALFVSFVANNKNVNAENDEIFKQLTGFSIDEINNNFISGTIKNKGTGIYERPYDKFEILEIYADDIVYAIAKIMQKKDGNKTNKSFNDLLEENKMEYNFKCPLFDGPCLIPYSLILNAGYDIGDCTGNLAGGLHSVDFRNNRIYTQNHLLYGYYKGGTLTQKYGCNHDDKDYHIFSLEDIGAFRDNNEIEYKYADSEGLYFFESIDFILQEKNRIEKENGWKELNVYIETDTSNSRYLQDIAESITIEERSDNHNLLAQGEPEKLKKLNPKIDFKEKIKEAQIIAKRNRVIRLLTKYEYNFIGEYAKFDKENELASDGTDTVKAEYDKVKFHTDNYIILNNFIENFIEILDNYYNLYKIDNNVYAVSLDKSKNKILEIRIDEVNKRNINSRLELINEKDFNEQGVLLSKDGQKEFIQELKLDSCIESNIRAFNKNKLKGKKSEEREQYLKPFFSGAEFEEIKVFENSYGQEILLLKLKDGKGNIYYTKTSIQDNIKEQLNFEVKTYDKNIFEQSRISEYEKEKLLEKIISVKPMAEVQLGKELQKTEVVEIEVPSLLSNKAQTEFLQSINDFIKGMFPNIKQEQNQIPQLILKKEQLTPQLQKWAKDNNIELALVDIKYEAVKNERAGNFLLQYRNGKIIKYEIRKNENGIKTITVFSKEEIKFDETDLINDVLQDEFPNSEFAEFEQDTETIITDFEKKYNITKTEKEIYKLVDDNSSISEIKENTIQTDLIKDLLSAS